MVICFSVFDLFKKNWESTFDHFMQNKFANEIFIFICYLFHCVLLFMIAQRSISTRNTLVV